MEGGFGACASLLLGFVFLRKHNGLVVGHPRHRAVLARIGIELSAAFDDIQFVASVPSCPHHVRDDASALE